MEWSTLEFRVESVDGAGAILEEPIRIGKVVAADQETRARLNWTATSQAIEVSFESQHWSSATLDASQR